VGDGMTTRETVNGKLATVAHLTDAWVPCTPEEAAIVKVVFDDGGILVGFRTPKPQPAPSPRPTLVTKVEWLR
jgi:hypothetical protein